MDATLDAISVTYKFIDGAHFFVPADKKALGLCVANTDLEVAYNEVGEQLSKLASFKSGSNIHFVPAIPFDEFKKIITGDRGPVEDDDRKTAKTDWRAQ